MAIPWTPSRRWTTCSPRSSAASSPRPRSRAARLAEREATAAELTDALPRRPGAITSVAHGLAMRGLMRRRFESGGRSGFVFAITPAGALALRPLLQWVTGAGRPRRDNPSERQGEREPPGGPAVQTRSSERPRRPCCGGSTAIDDGHQFRARWVVRPMGVEPKRVNDVGNPYRSRRTCPTASIPFPRHWSAGPWTRRIVIAPHGRRCRSGG